MAAPTQRFGVLLLRTVTDENNNQSQPVLQVLLFQNQNSPGILGYLQTTKAKGRSTTSSLLEAITCLSPYTRDAVTIEKDFKYFDEAQSTEVFLATTTPTTPTTPTTTTHQWISLSSLFWGNEEYNISQPLKRALHSYCQQRYKEIMAAIAPPKQPSTQPRLVIIGSSVAMPEHNGWSVQLADVLRNRGNWHVTNVSKSGADTRQTLNRFKRFVVPEQPHVVIIALSLKNEGLLQRGLAAYESFKINLQRLIEMIRAINAIPVLGGVYPNNQFTPEHYMWLKQMKAEMESWKSDDLFVFDFLSALDDGKGHWKNGTYFDANHPSGTGHNLMFESIDLRIFDVLKERILF